MVLSDIIQWGTHILNGDMMEHNINFHEQYYNRDHHYISEPNYVENDETIAHTLQEEFSQLQMREDPQASSTFVQDWHSPYTWNHSVDHNSYTCANDDEEEDEEGEGETVEPSSSCSSPCDGVDQYSCSRPLDGEVDWRLDQMAPIPLVPKINGEIPSIDEAASDHQRLLDRLQIYDFTEHKVQGDGNCQFRALSDQLHGTSEDHESVRRNVVNQLKSHPENYEGYVPMAYDDYLDKMSRSGEWGDHVTLQAAADSYGVKIFVIASFKDTCLIEILPNFKKPKQVIYLSFWAEVHYNSIYPLGGSDMSSGGNTDSSEFRKKRRWWNFGSKH